MLRLCCITFSNIHFLALYANPQEPEQFTHRTREAQADGNRSWCIFQAKIDERILRNIIHCTAELHYRFIAYRELDETKVVVCSALLTEVSWSLTSLCERFHFFEEICKFHSYVKRTAKARCVQRLLLLSYLPSRRIRTAQYSPS